MIENNGLEGGIPLSIARAARLNRNFEKGESVFKKENLWLIRSVENPILVDFNNTLVSNSRPWTLNPDAATAVLLARQIGTIIVVTSNSTDWDLRQKALDEFGIWHPDMILMTQKNYVPGSPREKARAKESIKDYIWFNKLLGKDYSNRDLNPYFHKKRLAPIFAKAYDIPLIDDLAENTLNNPGIFGIQIQNWQAPKEVGGTLPNISEAVLLTANHYSSLNK